MTRHVIIGNGVAGMSAAETIRSLDPRAEIALIAGETFPPYSRPMISLVLEGALSPEKTIIWPEGYEEHLDLALFLGHLATEINLDRRVVATDQGAEVRFDRLLIASGAHPRTIKAEGLDLEGIHCLRTMRDASDIVQGLDRTREALVLGGGLVGFKAAHGLLGRGVKVTMLIKSGYPLSMQVDRPAGEMVLKELTDRGLEVKVEVEAVGFEGRGRVEQALLSDGSRRPCQTVVIGKGVWPSLSFVPRDRIAVDLGVRVNSHLETSAMGVFAAGDAAEAFDAVRGLPWVNAIWPVAVEQGRIAGMNMAGYQIRYPGSLGRNVMRVFGLDVLTGGIVDPPQGEGFETFIQNRPSRKSYRKVVVKDGLLKGMVWVGGIDQGGVILSLMQRNLPLEISPELLLDPHFNFARLRR